MKNISAEYGTISDGCCGHVLMPPDGTKNRKHNYREATARTENKNRCLCAHAYVS